MSTTNSYFDFDSASLILALSFFFLPGKMIFCICLECVVNNVHEQNNCVATLHRCLLGSLNLQVAIFQTGGWERGGEEWALKVVSPKGIRESHYSLLESACSKKFFKINASLHQIRLINIKTFY